MTALDLKINFSKAQYQIYKDKSRFKVVVAGRRMGKTYLVGRDILLTALQKPGSIIFYLAPTFRQAELIMWQDLTTLVPSELLAAPPNNTKLQLIFKNGSRVRLFGAKEYDNIRGAGIHYAILDEFAFMKPQVWKNVIRPMLATTNGKCIFISTPNPAGGEWAKELYEEAKTGVKPEWKSFHFTSIQGGLIPEEEILAAKNDLSDKQFKIEYEASFELLEGLIYYAFSDANLSHDCKDDGQSPLLIGMDFNVNPMTAVICQKRANELHVIDEITLQDSNTDEICQEIVARYPKRKINVYPDPSGKARKTSASGDTDFTIIRSYGLGVVASPAAPLVQDRFNEVNAMLKNAKDLRRLKINPTCKMLIKSLKGFTYKENSRIPDKSKGVEHWTDALGYLIHEEYPIIQRPMVLKVDFG